MEPKLPDVTNRLRNEARARRDALGADMRAAWSARLVEPGGAALRERVTAGSVVSAYWPMRSEADPPDPAKEPPPKVTVAYLDERTDKSVPLPMNPDWWK